MDGYINVFTRRGLGGARAKHASRVYPTAREAGIGRGVPPDAGWELFGTLYLGGVQPTFVSEQELIQRAEAESASALRAQLDIEQGALARATGM